MSKPDVSIIIVSFNTKNLTVACLNSVIKHTKGVVYEVIVIDNASTDGSFEEIQKISKKHKKIHLVKSNKNLGFGGGNNLGMERARGRHILLLNSDTKLHEDSISKMVDWMDKHNMVGVATCKLTNPDGSIQATGGSFPTVFRLFSWAFFLDDLPLWSSIFGSYHPHTPKFASNFYKKIRKLDWITGAFMLIRHQVYESVGGFDQKFFMYAEDVEYSFRVASEDFQIWYVPITSILHIGGASSPGEGVEFADNTGKERGIVGEFEGLKLFYKKHLPNSYSLAKTIMKMGAILRIILFGVFLGQHQARKIYAKAFQSI